jgi:hypothetical protein
MGPSVAGFMPEFVGKPRTLDDGKPGAFYIARYQNLDAQSKSNFLRGYSFEGGTAAA